MIELDKVQESTAPPDWVVKLLATVQLFKVLADAPAEVEETFP